MNISENTDIKQIGQTIRAVIETHSPRLLKSDLNTPARSAITFMTIRALVNQALADSGLPIDFILFEIDPTDLIKAQMVKDGYNLPVVLEYGLTAEFDFTTVPLTTDDDQAAA